MKERTCSSRHACVCKGPAGACVLQAVHDSAPEPGTPVWAHIEVSDQAFHKALFDTRPLLLCAGMWAHAMAAYLGKSEIQAYSYDPTWRPHNPNAVARARSARRQASFTVLESYKLMLSSRLVLWHLFVVRCSRVACLLGSSLLRGVWLPPVVDCLWFFWA